MMLVLCVCIISASGTVCQAAVRDTGSVCVYCQCNKDCM